MTSAPTYKGTLVLDICSKDEKIQEAIWHPEGQEAQSLEIFHHLGTYVDAVLIGPLTVNCIDVRFYNYPCRMEFYDCNVEQIKIVNHLPYTLEVRGLIEPVDLEPNESAVLVGDLIW